MARPRASAKSAPATIRVRVLPGRSLSLDRAYGEGEELDLPAAEAAALVERGFVLDAKDAALVDKWPTDLTPAEEERFRALPESLQAARFLEVARENRRRRPKKPTPPPTIDQILDGESLEVVKGS